MTGKGSGTGELVRHSKAGETCIEMQYVKQLKDTTISTVLLLFTIEHHDLGVIEVLCARRNSVSVIL